MLPEANVLLLIGKLGASLEVKGADLAATGGAKVVLGAAWRGQVGIVARYLRNLVKFWKINLFMQLVLV